MTAALARRDTVVLEPDLHEGTPPPHDLEAEAATLGAIFIDGGDLGALRMVSDFLRPEHFYSEQHRRVYEALLAHIDQDQQPDIVTVASELRAKGRLQQVGGVGYLTDLLNATPAVGNVRKYAETVFDAWRLRQALLHAQETQAKIYEGVETSQAQAFLEGIGKSTFALAVQSPRSTAKHVKDVFKDFFRAVAAASRADAGPKPQGLTTTFPTLDRMCGGLHRGKKVTIAALPGGGKTVIGKQIVLANALAGVPCLLFITEQTMEEMADLIFASIARIDSRRIRAMREDPRKSGATKQDWAALTQAAEKFARVPLYIEYSTSLTVEDVATRTRELAQRLEAEGKPPLGICAVDHLHRLKRSRTLPQRASRTEELEHATASLKTLAQEANLVVLEMAQQRDAPMENGCKPKPKLLDVQWAPSKVAQESDMVLYVWERGPDDYVVTVPKVRGGEVGDIEVTFDKPHQRIVEREGDGPTPEWSASREEDAGGW